MPDLALFDGGPPTIVSTRGLTNTQFAILRHVAEHGSIRSVEAGVILHRARGTYPNGNQRCGSGAKGSYQASGIGCCAYASADGSMALRRLRDRGLLVRIDKGRWVTP